MISDVYTLYSVQVSWHKIDEFVSDFIYSAVLLLEIEELQ